MAKCFSFTSSRNSCFRYAFTSAGLKSVTTDLGDGTVMHCWVPNKSKPSKPTLLLIHGFGANAMWQWSDFVPSLASKFNLYVPDLVFFGDSYTSRPDRTEAFQAQCMMRTMEAHGVSRMIVAGISYGGFVGFSLAAQFPEAVEKLVLVCAGVCFEAKDMEDGMFRVKSVEEAGVMLLPQTPEKLRELMTISFFKPPSKNVPSCFLADYIDVMCTDFIPEKKELIEALYKDRKLSNLPKIDKPTLIVWGEQDQVFPLELGHRLKRHLGESAELVIVKNCGHAINIEKSKELFRHLKLFLLDPLPSPKHESNGNNQKLD